MSEQIKLSVDENLAKVFRNTARELGYLSAQEFIVESARKRAIAFRVSGLKNLQGSLLKKEINKIDEDKILSEFFESGSQVFRKFKRNLSQREI